MRKFEILGIRNKDKECWEINCPICNIPITKFSIVIDGKCDICNFKWKRIDNNIIKKSRIALILE